MGERNPPSVRTHLRAAYRGLSTTYGPTGVHRKSLAIAKQLLESYETELNRITDDMLPKLTATLKAAGAPYIMGDH